MEKLAKKLEYERNNLFLPVSFTLNNRSSFCSSKRKREAGATSAIL